MYLEKPGDDVVGRNCGVIGDKLMMLGSVWSRFNIFSVVRMGLASTDLLYCEELSIWMSMHW